MGKTKHEQGYQTVTRVAELQAELLKQAQVQKSRGDADALQGTNTVKIEVARRELNRMRTMVLLPCLEELEELKLHVVASEDDLSCRLRDAVSERDKAVRQAHEADLRWSKSSSVIQQERDRSAELEAALGSVKEGSKSVFLEAGALLHLTSDLIVRQTSLQADHVATAHQLVASECEATELRTKCDELRRETVRLKLDVKENERVRDAATAAIAQLESDKDSLAEQLEALQQHADMLEQTSTTQKQQVSQLSASLAEEETGRQRLQEQRASLQAQMEAQRQELQRSHSLLQSLRHSVEKASEVISRECGVLGSHLGTARNEMISEGADMYSQHAELHSLSRRLQDSLEVRARRAILRISDSAAQKPCSPTKFGKTLYR